MSNTNDEVAKDMDPLIYQPFMSTTAHCQIQWKM